MIISAQTAKITSATEETFSCPPSATSPLICTLGLVALFVATFIVRFAHPFGRDVVLSVLFIVCITAATILATDILWSRVYLRDSTGLDFDYDRPSAARSFTKYAGLLVTVGTIGLLYWLFPEYHEDFYKPYFDILKYLVPIWLLLAFPYIYLTDRHMRNPNDAYWQIGRAIVGDWESVNVAEIVQFSLGWLVKGFFLPLMFKFLSD